MLHKGNILSLLKNCSLSYITYIVTLIITFTATNAKPAAWTQNKGNGQAIFSLDGYQSSHYFDNNGKSSSSGSNFNKYAINPFFEYGLTSDITIGVNPILQYWQVGNVSDVVTNSNFRTCGTDNIVTGQKASGEIFESDLFIRKKLLEVGNAVFSIQPLIKTPCVLNSSSGTSIAWNSYDVELRTLVGYGFKWDEKLLGNKIRPFSGQYHFINLETAYRKRAGDFSDQVKIDSTTGFRYNENILLLSQLFSTISTGKENISNTEIAYERFGSLKLQLSGVVQSSKTTSVQLGIYKEIVGKNYGDGQGILLSLWKGF